MLGSKVSKGRKALSPKETITVPAGPEFFVLLIYSSSATTGIDRKRLLTANKQAVGC